MKVRNICRTLVRKLEEEKPLGSLGIDGRIVLK
jgi:hypothetical protein